jgi:hypothetical protein
MRRRTRTQRFFSQEELEQAIQQSVPLACWEKAVAMKLRGYKIINHRAHPVPIDHQSKYGTYWHTVFMQADQGRLLIVFPNGDTRCNINGKNKVEYKYPWAGGVQGG